MTHNDEKRDDALGRVLRQALEAPGDVETFVARLFDRVDRVERIERVERSRGRAWDTLASWSRWGVAAAAVVLTVVAVAWLHQSDRDAALDAALATDDGETARLLSADDAPDPEVYFVLTDED
jgi:anti-sigma-K factor RskA